MVSGRIDALLMVSIHAFRGEGDGTGIALRAVVRSFNPRLPGGRRPDVSAGALTFALFQSTPSGGKATCERCRPSRVGGVSIHAFRGEGDGRSKPAPPARLRFNPRLPGGRRHHRDVGFGVAGMFQSTPSGGKATHRPRRPRPCSRFQSTPSGGKATCSRQRRYSYPRCFNPRLPGGRRPASPAQRAGRSKFQSTPSGGKATSSLFQTLYPRLVSIHAFRGEGDAVRASACGAAVGVSIHAFRGEGDSIPSAASSAPSLFQSTPSGGKATVIRDQLQFSARVSIHAFRGEGDLAAWLYRQRGTAFQSTPSGGKATS